MQPKNHVDTTKPTEVTHLSLCTGYGGRVVGDNRQTEPEVGGGVDGPADWVGYGELCVSSDNRTDELRMLGNGVVPATAARAFVTLMEELL